MRLSKIYKVTGLDENEFKKGFKFSITGFLLFLLSFFASCNKNNLKNQSISEPEKSDIKTATEMKASTPTTTYKIEKTTQSLEPQDTQSRNCGPVPGYPCGTRYYTISPRYFNI